ncbi:FMN-dependent NADH-azoreductase [Salsuginibacillus halophilus]|uniref:FMN dependent NADH:quinone oxidoreductase n=1 Tax=Salsuginibacillus halophilus TaxID=517424 RepID=A0A2P8HQG3_9BACI|nr:FMN-dependent NADH-azoreductase [Salsuginibacillus halophilus]PSL48448.1 FMN-dependent NADH-azoreductase [Salsuginibacillus halophilus]
MANVLFIKANGRPDDQAVSLQLFNTFKAQYVENHPEDHIEEIDLFAENLPYYDNDKITAMFKAGKGMELTEEEEKEAAYVKSYVDQFMRADKIVLAFPLWNFSVPAVLHTYFDYLCQAGTTFRYTANGPEGLLNGKQAFLLNARGGVYSEGPAAGMEMAVTYVTKIMNFLGIEDTQEVIVEGHNQFPDKAEEIIEAGLEEAKEAAVTF